VLIFGGVQWLATQHIHMLLKTLAKYENQNLSAFISLLSNLYHFYSLKLQGIKLVMKTLGAGFHQHIEGVHCLSLVSYATK